MVCFHPIEMFYPAVPDEDGKSRLLGPSGFEDCFGYKPQRALVQRKPSDKSNIDAFLIRVPCGKCIGCRLDYSRMWAIRSVHEAMMHKDNTFVTLTFNDEHLPDDRSLHKSEIQSWLKRFRKRFGSGIRYMVCGEYGDKTQRPHYHIIFFNFKFPDMKFWTTRHGQIYYRSDILESLWTDPWSKDPRGYCVIGDVTFESSAYVARYVTKKLDGYLGESKYNGREKEFLSMSRMPGIGTEFFMKNYKDIYNHGYILLPNKHKAPIPRFYDYLLEKIDPELLQQVKLDKKRYMIHNLFMENIDESVERLLVREELQKMKLDKLVRAYEFSADLHNIY